MNNGKTVHALEGRRTEKAVICSKGILQKWVYQGQMGRNGKQKP